MTTLTFRILLALIGLTAFVALLLTTISLAHNGQPIWAAFTGTGAVAIGMTLLFKLLLTLGRTA